jgi:hypothetical protein
MGLFKLLASAIRRIVRFPLFQFAAVVAIVLFLQAADEQSLFGWIFDELDRAVAATVSLCSNLFSVKSFTRSGLTLFLTVAYVYVAIAIALFVLRAVLRGVIDLMGWSTPLVLETPLPGKGGLRLIGLGCPLNASGRPRSRKNNGSRLSHGRPTISRHILRCPIVSCAPQQGMFFCS